MSIEETLDDVGALAAELRAEGGRHRWRCLVHVFRAGEDEPPGGRPRWRLTGQNLVIGRRPGPNGVELADSAASREHCELLYEAAVDGYRLVDRDSRNGTWLDGRRATTGVLRHGSVIRVGASIFVYVDQVVPEGLLFDDVAGHVAITRAIAESSADLAAPTELPVLLIGPTGAGKEVLAQRIHAKSGRKGAFIAVNCATLAKELISSELFGHTAGAFSGANKARSGLFVAAQGGTLMLDEIGELPLDQQPALLRALQERKVRPVGADQEVPVDVRVVAATHQSLARMEQAERFRADLHARLAGFVIELPGLSVRREEILRMFVDFLGEPRKRLTRDAAEALLLYDWPHNVRELKHAAERARLLAQAAREVDLAQLPPAVQRRTASPAETIDESTFALRSESLAPEPSMPKETTPSREELISLLHRFDGNVAQICRLTGKHRQQVYRWLKKYDLDLDQYRREEPGP